MIEINNLCKEYITYKRGHTFLETVISLFKREMVPVHALKNVSFTIDDGELIGLLGPNGAGKSTTIKILTGILYPTSGTAQCNGFTPWKERKKYVKHIGAVFGQKSQLIWDIPPIDSFYMNQAIYDIDDTMYNQRLGTMVELLQIEGIITKPTRNLSLGERMKCEFVMAMLHDPKIVFLDEPTIGLDVIAKEKIRTFIKEMNSRGTTFILTTHDLDDVEHLVDRVITINHGVVVFDGKLTELKKHLGEKKIIRISTHKKLSLGREKGIAVISKISDFEAEVEIDLSALTLNEFIKYVNSKSNIRDMNIGDVSLETVIKNLYQAKKN